MDIFSLGGVILDLLQTVVDFWNDKVSLVFELLGQSPVSFKNGGPWAVVANLEPYLWRWVRHWWFCSL